MPINKKHPLAVLMDALRAYPPPKRRRITIEYTLVAGRNDAPDEAERLARLLRGLPVKINLIPMNPIAGESLRVGSLGRSRGSSGSSASFGRRGVFRAHPPPSRRRRERSLRPVCSTLAGAEAPRCIASDRS